MNFWNNHALVVREVGAESVGIVGFDGEVEFLDHCVCKLSHHCLGLEVP